ncbi:hypothetical protein [Salipiger bermudensis]|uniref:hypothetical protein n=1 Tax=Salipiger bermudensis TaxID=344736 RepID=UPI001CD75756|nr:hypothetical protein [Salipiger bermudensis]MCA0964891.1 hypothetical protein [Salipiger bermudensis]
MLKKSWLLLPLIATAGCLALPPQGIEDAQLRAFDEAVASIGCNLDYEADYLAVELQTGLAREQVQQVANYRIAAGAGESSAAGGFRLTTGSCAPEAAAPVAEAAPAPVGAG